MPKTPEMINDARAYINGSADFYPTTELELPEIESLTADVEGAGLSGKIEAPVEGQIDSMEAKITMRVLTAQGMTLIAGRPITLDVYADIQRFDAGANAYSHSQMRSAMRGRIKSVKPGSLKRGETTDSEFTIEVHYLKIEYDGKTTVEIDKFGYKCVIDGVDLLREVRANIGM